MDTIFLFFVFLAIFVLGVIMILKLIGSGKSLGGTRSDSSDPLPWWSFGSGSDSSDCHHGHHHAGGDAGGHHGGHDAGGSFGGGHDGGGGDGGGGHH
jgi:hypothetical protein